MSRRDVRGQRVVITGGSSGIGKQVAFDGMDIGEMLVLARAHPDEGALGL